MTLQLIIVLILVGGWLFGRLASRIGLPSVLGMTIWGVLIGSLWGDFIPPALWEMAPFLKSLALIVILLRAGLGINVTSLRKVGLVAVKMAFIPALCEASALVLLFHYVLGFDWIVAALAAALLSAVSPAAVVPSMLTLKEEGYGHDKDVTTMMLAGASLDNVTVITMFTLFLGLSRGEDMNFIRTILMVPWSILLGILPGIVIGFMLVWFFERFYEKIRATEKMLLLLGISVVLVQVGDWTQTSALLGVMTIGFILLAKANRVAGELSRKLNKMWVFSEIILFVLIGMSVQINVALKAGPQALLMITGGLAARSIGVLAATAGSDLNRKERLFSIIAYLPKATVQAALGAVPLQEGVANGELILAYAVVAIIYTAPLGLISIRLGGPRLLQISLKKENEWEDVVSEIPEADME